MYDDDLFVKYGFVGMGTCIGWSWCLRRLWSVGMEGSTIFGISSCLLNPVEIIQRAALHFGDSPFSYVAKTPHIHHAHTHRGYSWHFHCR
jgi:hypothetical protein